MKRVIAYIVTVILLLLVFEAKADGTTNPYLNRYTIFSEPYLAIIETGDTVIMVDIRTVVCMPCLHLTRKSRSML